jgi:hypothetical protein
MPEVEFEPAVPVHEQAKTVHALDLVATVLGSLKIYHFRIRNPYNKCASLNAIFTVPREGRRNVEQSAAETVLHFTVILTVRLLIFFVKQMCNKNSSGLSSI